MKKTEIENEGVSPVVGVMLLLVLTIILAAVISGFAGGIAGGSDKGEIKEIIANTRIINTGTFEESRFEIDILSVNTPVSTKDLKLRTSWKIYDRDDNLLIGENSISAGSDNFLNKGGGVSPLGHGPGISEWNRTTDSLPDDINFGKYALMPGTKLVAYPDESYGTPGYSSAVTDSIQAVLGHDWDKLSSGDVVSVMLIHVPSGRIIYDDDVYVNG